MDEEDPALSSMSQSLLALVEWAWREERVCFPSTEPCPEHHLQVLTLSRGCRE